MKWSPASCSLIFLLAILLLVPHSNCTGEIISRIDVAPVWSGHPVGFSLLTHEDRQFVAFYDDERYMTVGVRALDEDHFDLVRLPQRTGWDSHNYITLAIDAEDSIHLSGDMHVAPLIYFRTENPTDIHSFRKIPEMVGRDEDRVTYPRFFPGPRNELIFTYRDGGSGNGEQIYNRYDPSTQTWRRLLDQPLVTGEGKRNAYLHGPIRGPDGYFHLCWIWRDTPDCSTNHHISYARSRDLTSWEKGDGEPIALPITFTNGDVVDPVPPRGGAINGNVVLGFDSRQRPILSYHKFDDDGITQLYNARFEEGKWKIYQTSNWDYRWWFEGGGSIPFEIRIGPPKVTSEGELRQAYRHVKYGNRTMILDEKTLQPVQEIDTPASRPPELDEPQAEFPGMEVQWASDSGGGARTDSRYWLRWETLPRNRDRPREGPLPEPTMLQLYEIRHP